MRPVEKSNSSRDIDDVLKSLLSFFESGSRQSWLCFGSLPERM
jgi:hypothetical protein